MAEITIAVSGLNNTDNPGPGIPVIRSIRESGDFTGKIIGLSYDTLEPGIYMPDMVDDVYMIPYPSGGSKALLQRLQYIHANNPLDVIIPTLDSEIAIYIAIQGDLAAMGIKVYLPLQEQLNMRAKDKLFDFCKKAGVRAPKNTLLTSPQELYALPATTQYPVVVKGIYYEAYICNNFDEVTTAFHKLKNKWGYPILVQEYLKGDEFNVCALGDGTGKAIGAVAMRKLYITDKGKGWAGVTIDDRVLTREVEKLIAATKWRSGMELEFLKSAENGEFYLIEINPRFPAWVYLTTAAGNNLPAALLQLALGKPVPELPKPEVGKIFARCSWDLITTMKTFEHITVTGELHHG